MGRKGRLRVVGDYALVDDVHDAIGDEDVRREDAGGVDEKRAVLDHNVQSLAVVGCQLRVIAERCRVAHCPIDDVVGKDAGELRLR